MSFSHLDFIGMAVVARPLQKGKQKISQEEPCRNV